MLHRPSPRALVLRYPHRRGNAAFGLLALLIVAAIVLYLLFGMGGGSTTTTPAGGGGGGGGGGYVGAVAGARKAGKELRSDLNTRQIALLIAQYKQANNKWPASVADLEAPPQTVTDRWGNQISFTIQENAPGGTSKVTIRTKGPDAQPNTPDDEVMTADVPF